MRELEVDGGVEKLEGPGGVWGLMEALLCAEPWPEKNTAEAGAIKPHPSSPSDT